MKIPPNINVLKPKFIQISDETSERRLCQQILPAGPTNDKKALAASSLAGPTLLLDTTVKPSVTGVRSSQLVKTFVRKAGIPTISTGYSIGSEEETAWRDLTKREREWLIHVQPPGDIMPTMIADLCEHFNLTTAVIFYDKTFGETRFLFECFPNVLNFLCYIFPGLEMAHKYSTLFEDTDTRYVLRSVQESSADIEALLDDLKERLMLHYFVLGSMETINKFLEAVS